MSSKTVFDGGCERQQQVLRVGLLGVMTLSLHKSSAQHFRNLTICHDVGRFIDRVAVGALGIYQFGFEICCEFVGLYAHLFDYGTSMTVLLLEYAQQKVLRSDNHAVEPYGFVAAALENVLYLFRKSYAHNRVNNGV